MTKATQAEATNHKAARMAIAAARRMGEKLGVKSVIVIGAPCQEL
jgi:coenzyme F420-reducing hydrogenase beta subunit